MDSTVAGVDTPPGTEQSEDDSQPITLGKKSSTELSPGDVPSDAVNVADGSTGKALSLRSRQRDPPVNPNQPPPAPSDSLKTKKTSHDKQEARQALNKFKTTAADTLSKVGSKAAEGSAWVWEASKVTAQATADGLKKLKVFGTPLESLCKQESAARMIPRVVLVCCTAIVSGDLQTKDLFEEEAPKKLVEALTDHFHLGNGAVLPPPGTSIHIIAGVLKHFLSSLQDPLLTYRLAPEWIVAGQEPMRGKLLVHQLPTPNANAFDVILDTCHRISGHSAENGMDARALAEALVPVLLWKPPQKYPTKTVSKPANVQHGLMSRFWLGKDNKRPNITEDEDYNVVHLTNTPEEVESPRPAPTETPDAAPEPPPVRAVLEGGELEAVVCVVTYLITEYRTV